MTKRTTIIVAVVIALIVVGAAVGGGVGGSLASKTTATSSLPAGLTTSTTSSGGGVVTVTVDRSTSSSTTSTSSDQSSATSSSTSSSASSTQTSGMGSYDCPAVDNTQYIPSISTSSTFTIVCDADQPKGVTGTDGGTVDDLNDGVLATSIESCIDACAGNALGGGGCTAVTYGANITAALARGGITGNCFFKDQRAQTFVDDTSGQVISAYLDT